MIIKSFELNKIDLKLNKFILFYGKNEGLKNEALDILFRHKNSRQVLAAESPVCSAPGAQAIRTGYAQSRIKPQDRFP